MPKQGLHLIKPSAVTTSGSSSSSTINTNGSVSFTSALAINIEGVFSSAYDNYQIVMRMTHSSSTPVLICQVMSGSSVDSTEAYRDWET